MALPPWDGFSIRYNIDSDLPSGNVKIQCHELENCNDFLDRDSTRQRLLSPQSTLRSVQYLNSLTSKHCHWTIDLKTLAQDGVLSSIHFDANTLEKPLLNEYAGLGKEVHVAVRQLLLDLLEKDTSLGSKLRDNEERNKRALVPLGQVKMHLPIHIGDYTDFFVGVYHARNVSHTTSDPHAP